MSMNPMKRQTEIFVVETLTRLHLLVSSILSLMLPFLVK